MLKTEAELLTLPTGGAELAERQATWVRRRERWEDIRRHEAQAVAHRRLAEEHHSKAAKLLTEADAS